MFCYLSIFDEASSFSTPERQVASRSINRDITASDAARNRLRDSNLAAPARNCASSLQFEGRIAIDVTQHLRHHHKVK
jgi:hypothetical protein